MVKLHVKKGDESQFLFETTVKEPINVLVANLVKIFNGRLKIDRLYHELETLAKHGITLPPNMQGLTDEQIEELKLEDKWSKTCIPHGGSVYVRDPVGRRTGNAPNANMADVINRTRSEAKAQVSKDLATANKCITFSDVQDALDKMKGSVMIVYPMGLPPHDPVKMELDNQEDLTGTQASKEVLEESNASLWWAGKELMCGKTLQDYVGKNEKTKIIVKLQKKGHGPPSREPVINEDEQKAMMAHYYRKQEEMKKLSEDEQDLHLNSDWADSAQLKRQFQGLNNVSWRPR
ncbi:cilia- and flagella-associated protein 298-like [Hydractinia symbiolongicarpus]|uniref:cilia- and flagella-associated protein 298-like n=1 Tax=Hydractinia symbiolongicarpus TaxID=13093 RepID=UPI00254FAF34|nr:cilia- and flagella-associated protein 298-like [Hydractinia symbiolongicarpus]